MQLQLQMTSLHDVRLVFADKQKLGLFTDLNIIPLPKTKQ